MCRVGRTGPETFQEPLPYVPDSQVYSIFQCSVPSHAQPRPYSFQSIFSQALVEQ